MKNTAPSSARPALPGASINFSRVRANAQDKGYETFVVDSMLHRAAASAMVDTAALHAMDVGTVQREVGQKFLKIIDECGGFRQAYQQELKLIRQAGAAIPEQRLADLALSAAAFLEHTDKKTPTAFYVKERLIAEARSAASALRTLGLDDQIVVRRLQSHPGLAKHEITARAAEMIEDDRTTGQDARAKARAGVAAVVAAGAPNAASAASAPRMH